MTVNPSDLPPPRPAQRIAEWGLLLLCLFLFFWRLGAVPLFDLDEALYVTAAHRMVASGDIVTPRLNSRPLRLPNETATPFFEKPILVYWACAASMRLFGASETAARLPVAVAALLTTGLVGIVGRRWFGRRAGLLAALIYATAPMTLIDARQMTTDGLLVLWFTIAFVAFYEMYSRTGRHGEAERPPGSAAALVIFWTACALAVLTKGAVGLLIPALVIGATLLFRHVSAAARWGDGFGLRFRMAARLRSVASAAAGVRTLRPLLGMLLVTVIAAPWHLAILRTHDRDSEGRTWTQEYIMRQHIGRFKGLDTVHNAPLPSYFVYFLFGFFPWSCLAPAAFRRAGDHPAASAHPDRKGRRIRFRIAVEPGAGRPAAGSAAPDSTAAAADYLRVWFWTIFLFFTIGAAKLPTYIVPCYPAAALLVGLWLDQALEGLRGRIASGVLAAAITAGVLLAGAFVAPRLVPADRPIPAEMIAAVRHLTLLLWAGCTIARGCMRWRNEKEHGGAAAIGVLAATMVGVIAIGASEGYNVAARYVLGPYQRAAAAARPDAERGTPVIFYHIIPRRPSMLYYGGYAPLERKEEPLLPFLRGQMAAPGSAVDVVTSGDVLAGELQSELAAAPDLAASVVDREGAERGGWVLVRIRKK